MVLTAKTYEVIGMLELASLPVPLLAGRSESSPARATLSRALCVAEWLSAG